MGLMTANTMRDICSRLVNRWFPQGGFARSVSVLAGGTAAAQVIAIALSPILTRIYKPGDFGVLQVFISLLGLAVVVSSGRYELAVLLPEDEQTSIDVLAVAIGCVCATTGVVAGVAIFCHYRWVLPASVSVLNAYMWLLPISVFGGGLYQVLSYWAMRRNSYSQIATSKLAQATGQVTTQIVIGVGYHGPLGLLAGDAVGRVMGSGRFIRDLWRDYSDRLRSIRISSMRRVAVRYRDFPLFSLWGSLINSSGLALPSLFLAQYYGAQGTGWFALVNRVFGVPAALIGLSISQVYASKAAALSMSDPKHLMHIFLKTTRHMLLLGLPPCVLLTIFAPVLFQFVFGLAWREAGEYARYLILMFLASFINSPVQMTLNILERQHSQLAWDICRLALTVIAIVLPFQIGYGPRVAIFSYGAAMTIMYVVHWGMSHHAINRCIEMMELPSVESKEVWD
jgi:O-antigen/teichoic acid export membrane protein